MEHSFCFCAFQKKEHLRQIARLAREGPHLTEIPKQQFLAFSLLWLPQRIKDSDEEAVFIEEDEPANGDDVDAFLNAAPLPEVPELDDVPVTASPPSQVAKGAEFLEGLLARRSGVVMKHVAADQGVSSKLLQRRSSAAAEACMRLQWSQLQRVLEYISQMAGHTLEPLAYIERQAYDATPCRLRVPNQEEGGQEARKVKIYMVESEIAILLCKADHLHKNSPEDFLLLRLPFSHMPRVAAKGTGACTQEVLKATLPMSRGRGASPEIEELFKGRVFRLCETDGDGANFKAEQLLKEQRPQAWRQGALLHVVCSAHKAHAAVEKTWGETPMSDIITGMINCYLALDDLEVLNAVRRFMDAEITTRLQVFVGSECSESAKLFQENCKRYFWPKRSRSRIRSQLHQVCEVLNGDWRVPGCLQHHCRNCCSSKASTERKLKRLLATALLSLRCGCLCRDNWVEWPDQMVFIAWSHLLHQFMQDAFLHVLRGEPQLPAPMNEDEQPENPIGDRVPGHDPERAGGADGLAGVQAARAERAKCLRLALAFLSDPSWFKHLYILRVSLQVQVPLMRHLVHSVSKEEEIDNMYGALTQGHRRYRVVQLLEQEQLQQSFTAGVDQITDPTCWGHLGETEELRSLIWKTAFRTLATIWQLITVPYTAWPWPLFRLLTARTQEVAASILAAPPCLRDEWGARFVAEFSTPELLLSEHCHQLLTCIASMLQCSTYSTERLHSVNLRRSKTRVHVKRMSVAEVAKKHAAAGCFPWLLPKLLWSPKSVCLRKRGRPKKKKQPQDQGAQPRKARRTGSGGAWRAFQHCRFAGRKFEPEELRQAAQEYRALSEDQLAHYRRLGSLGL